MLFVVIWDKIKLKLPQKERKTMKENKNKKVTIKDIAKEAGVSTAAVSLVLNNRPCRITEEKKQLVRDTAKKLNYVVNQAAKSLATRRSYMLALILPDIENTFFSSLAKQIENRCQKKGYSLIIASSDDRASNERKLLRILESRGVDGIFLIMSNESFENPQELAKELKLRTMPYVMLDRTYRELDCSRVRFDHEQGGYLAVRYLLEQGHRKIGCIYKDDKTGNGRSRLDGYLRALEEFHVPVKQEYLQQGDYRLESGYRAAEQLLKTDMTAVFICNDMMTLGFLKKLYDENMQVPQDYSVVSYDDSLQNYLLGIELTTVAQDIVTLAEQACQMMFGKLEGEDCLENTRANQEVVLIPELRIRESVKSQKNPINLEPMDLSVS